MLLGPINVYAYSGVSEDFCLENSDQCHNFKAIVQMANTHPHSGYMECACGKRQTLSKIYKYDCEICRKELCEMGIHYFLYNVVGEYNGESVELYGVCECGEERFLDNYETWQEEKEAQISLYYNGCGLITDEKFSHIIYESESNVFFSNDIECEGECEACIFMSEYIDECYNVSLDMLEMYDEEYEYYDAREHYIQQYLDGSYDYDDVYEEESTDELYEWIDSIKEWLNQ